MAAITIRGAEKSFGDTKVLHGVDLDVADGEFVVLVGPSGCGKSTLLRLIAGLEEASAGTIEIGGRRVDDLAPRDRDIAMVFQSYALYPHMSVEQNMGYALRLRRAGREAIAAAVDRAAGILDIAPLLGRRPRALSGGQRQRVAMGRAMVRAPAAFLFDEPLSNLDARLREHMRTEIRRLHRTLGTTSIYVTHDQIEAMTMADRIVAMQGGVVRQVGTPLELYDRPACAFVAGFIGAPVMNVLRAKADGAGALLRDGTRLPLPFEPAARELTVGLRPEDLAPSDDGLTGRVTLVEATGLTTLVHVDTDAGPLTWLGLSRPAAREGDAIRLRLDPARAHVFDAATGARLGP